MENAIHAQIDILFPDDQTVSALRITEYLDWAAHPEKYSNVLAMPPIQRGFVWKPKQIQDLWDSLLRGMPIGNYRAMDSSENRSRGDEPLVKELLEPSNKWDIYAINPADEIELQKWKLASHEKDGGKWDDDRLLAFQHAVESRVMYLYKRYFDEAEFKTWLQTE